MKKIMLIIVTCILLFSPLKVNANITCNDGTISPTCTDCYQGCCSGHGGCTSNPNHYSNKYHDTDNDQKTSQNDNNYVQIICAILVLGVIFGPTIYRIIVDKLFSMKGKQITNEYTFEERYQLYKYSIQNYVKDIMNSKKNKYSIIDIIINNEKIKSLVTYTKQVSSSKGRNGKVYYNTLYSVLHIKNLNTDEKTFDAYEQGANDIPLDIYCDVNDVAIYDCNKQIRKYFNFTAKNLTLSNIKNSKKECSKYMFKYVKLYLKGTNYHRNIVADIDIGQLKLLSYVCASIKIIEDDDEDKYECPNCEN